MERNEQTHALDASQHEGYRKIIGRLIFLATQTRSDLAVAASLLSSHLHNSTTNHMKRAKRTLHYLKRTSQYTLKVKPKNDTQLTAYVDANWANDVEINRRSRTGILLMYRNAVVAATTSLQKSASMSSTEADYVAVSDAAKK